MDAKEIISCIADKDSVKESFGRKGNLDGFLFTGSADSDAGFNFGYLMYVPPELRDKPVLIVEGPSVGEVGPIDRACEIIYDKALFELSGSGFPHHLAKELQCPIIMPLFSRPEDKENNTNIFTHALTSKAMAVRDSSIERTDLQLIAMFQDIKRRFPMPESRFMIN
ncbi:hypothetical protein [uncultured Acetatifactor sp.]|uniref:hypothetical protein n=1 Tax=uncultured Acetatifactor sp. TaxID=1671927 RepID=UPI0026389510|nr:hypothetical protein [uncultured Acetatifactor sp.]